MSPNVWKRIRHSVGGVLLLLALASSSSAQAPVDQRLENLEKQNEEFRRQVEQLQQQNQQLMGYLKSISASPAAAPAPETGTPAPLPSKEVKELVNQYLAEKEEKKKTEEAAKKQKQEDEGYRIGSILDIKASIDQNGYLWLYTPNKDFTMHIGEWTQYDNVFYNQSPDMRAIPGARPGHKQFVASGVAAGGIGNLQDGTYFRRLRPFLEGTLWENYEYRLIFAFENDQFSTAGLDEFWAGVNNIPLIGTIRAGHVKDVLGLEGDMTASSRCMTFMERSAYSDSIELNQNFVTGLWLGNNFFNERMTYSASAFRTDNGQATGVFFGDGQWGAGLRLTFLPLYECEGRHLLHLGTAVGWRNGTNNIATSPFRVFQVRARDELRDDDPAASPAGAQTVPNANSNRMIDTGQIAAEDDWIFGLELLYIRGPFSIQAEWGWNRLTNAFGVAPAGLTLNPAIIPQSDYTFNGGYVQLAYTLTGENRGYDKARGTLSRNYFNGGPFTRAWFVRDENGHLNWGLGAWEIAARYSYVNLNDGTGLNRIQGGTMNGVSVALNWYLNSNFSIMFDWVYDQRSDVPTGTIPGWVQGFGTRLQLSF
jgi:phosphate-selective porin OprO/OprP